MQTGKLISWAVRIGSCVVSVLVILWMILNAGNLTAPEHDLDSGPAPSWPQIIHHWIFDIGEIAIALCLIVGGWYVYSRWDNWRVRKAQRK